MTIEAKKRFLDNKKENKKIAKYVIEEKKEKKNK